MPAGHAALPRAAPGMGGEYARPTWARDGFRGDRTLAGAGCAPLAGHGPPGSAGARMSSWRHSPTVAWGAYKEPGERWGVFTPRYNALPYSPRRGRETLCVSPVAHPAPTDDDVDEDTLRVVRVETSAGTLMLNEAFESFADDFATPLERHESMGAPSQPPAGTHLDAPPPLNIVSTVSPRSVTQPLATAPPEVSTVAKRRASASPAVRRVSTPRAILHGRSSGAVGRRASSSPEQRRLSSGRRASGSYDRCGSGSPWGRGSSSALASYQVPAVTPVSPLPLARSQSDLDMEGGMCSPQVSVASCPPAHGPVHSPPPSMHSTSHDHSTLTSPPHELAGAQRVLSEGTPGADDELMDLASVQLDAHPQGEPLAANERPRPRSAAMVAVLDESIPLQHVASICVDEQGVPHPDADGAPPSPPLQLKVASLAQQELVDGDISMQSTPTMEHRRTTSRYSTTRSGLTDKARPPTPRSRQRSLRRVADSAPDESFTMQNAVSQTSRRQSRRGSLDASMSALNQSRTGLSRPEGSSRRLRGVRRKSTQMSRGMSMRSRKSNRRGSTSPMLRDMDDTYYSLDLSEASEEAVERPYQNLAVLSDSKRMSFVSSWGSSTIDGMSPEEGDLSTSLRQRPLRSSSSRRQRTAQTHVRRPTRTGSQLRASASDRFYTPSPFSLSQGGSPTPLGGRPITADDRGFSCLSRMSSMLSRSPYVTGTLHDRGDSTRSLTRGISSRSPSAMQHSPLQHSDSVSLQSTGAPPCTPLTAEHVPSNSRWRNSLGQPPDRRGTVEHLGLRHTSSTYTCGGVSAAPTESMDAPLLTPPKDALHVLALPPRADGLISARLSSGDSRRRSLGAPLPLQQCLSAADTVGCTEPAMSPHSQAKALGKPTFSEGEQMSGDNASFAPATVRLGVSTTSLGSYGSAIDAHVLTMGEGDASGTMTLGVTNASLASRRSADKTYPQMRY